MQINDRTVIILSILFGIFIAVLLGTSLYSDFKVEVMMKHMSQIVGEIKDAVKN